MSTQTRQILALVCGVVILGMLAGAAAPAAPLLNARRAITRLDNVAAAGPEILLLKEDKPLERLPWGYTIDDVAVSGEFIFMDTPPPGYTVEGTCTQNESVIECAIKLMQSGNTPGPQSTVTSIPTPEPTPEIPPIDPSRIVYPGQSGISEILISGYCTNGFAAWFRDGTKVLITNAHCCTASTPGGYPIYETLGGNWISPAPRFGGSPSEDIKGVSWFYYPRGPSFPNSAPYDACAVRLSHPGFMANTIGGLPINPTPYIDYKPNEQLCKTGATTGEICAKIVSDGGNIVLRVGKNGQYLVFGPVIIMQSTKDANGKLIPFMKPGDSGSLLYRKTANGLDPVGLCFAGTSDFKYSACAHIKTVLAGMHVSLNPP